MISTKDRWIIHNGLIKLGFNRDPLGDPNRLRYMRDDIRYMRDEPGETILMCYISLRHIYWGLYDGPSRSWIMQHISTSDMLSSLPDDVFEFVVYNIESFTNKDLPI